jgi:diguanylate cyclase (GGDEF)-like protein
VRLSPRSLLALSLLLAAPVGAVPERGDVGALKGRYWTAFANPTRFERISVSHGLSHNTVYSILQDRQGFLWFGTEDGLNRYDGYNFKVLRYVHSDPRTLTSSWVTCLLEDGDGSLWIGTTNGLSKLDRRNETILRYRATPSVSSSLSLDDIACLAQDGEGNLWIGTAGGGLNMIAARELAVAFPSFNYFGPSESDPRALGGLSIRALLVDSRGTLWVGCEDGGLFRLVHEPGTTRYEFVPLARDPARSSLAPPEDVLALAEDQHGQLWIGGSSGLYRFQPATGRLHRFGSEQRERGSLSHDYVRCLYVDRTGTLWVGTDGGGLDKLLPESARTDVPRFERFVCDRFASESLSNNAIESLYEDRSGVLWVGTYLGGLNKLVLRGVRPGHREERPFGLYQANPNDKSSLSGNLINAIAEDSRGQLWIGTDGDGLNRVIPPASFVDPLRFIHHTTGSGEGLPDDVITCMLADARGRLWLGTFTAGLVEVLLDPRAPRGPPRFRAYRHKPGDPTSLSSNFVISLLDDRQGRLWVGTIDGGLCLFDPQRGVLERFVYADGGQSISDNSVYVLAIDAHETLWIGTGDGLNRYNPRTREFRSYGVGASPAGLSSAIVRALYLDPGGVLWIGTAGGGLNQMTVPSWDGPPPAFTHHTTATGLPSDVVLGILPGEAGELWLSTNNGLGRLRLTDGSCRRFDQRDGLQSNLFLRNAHCRSRSGELLFGGINGFNVFHPADVVDNRNVPPIAIVELQLFNQPVRVGSDSKGRRILEKAIDQTEAIELSHRDLVFSLEFAALHYVAPDKNEYAYMLEGLDNGWNRVGKRRFVTYTTLPPGDYVFRVKGSNSDGLWNEVGTALRIHIEPPFWRTRWFWAAAIGLAGVVLASGHLWRIHRHKKRAKLLEQLVGERTSELARANKELARLARRDALTGIPNVRQSEETFKLAWAMAMRQQSPVAVILLDVDKFKEYNDHYGHSAGDDCLRQVAVALENSVRRGGDLAARYGGEEFVAILSGTDSEGALATAERIRAAVEGLQIPHEYSPVADHLTVSLGCASTIPTAKANPHDLLRAADRALYESKRKGRNCSTLASPSTAGEPGSTWNRPGP